MATLHVSSMPATHSRNYTVWIIGDSYVQRGAQRPWEASVWRMSVSVGLDGVVCGGKAFLAFFHRLRGRAAPDLLLIHCGGNDMGAISGVHLEMRGLLTTQSQNCYREQIQKEMMTRLAWKSRYAKLYPSSCKPGDSSTEPAPLQPLPAEPQAAVPPVVGKQNELPPPPPPHHHPPPHASPVVPMEGEQQLSAPPLMRPVSPQTRRALYQDSHNGKGRSLYLQRRGRIRPEEKFDFPLLSSWEYGWRLGDYTLDYRTPSSARSSLVKSTFYAKNGVFSSPSATDTLG